MHLTCLPNKQRCFLGVVHPHINVQVADQTRHLLGGIPCPSNQAANVGSKHCKRVVDAKYGVKSGLFSSPWPATELFFPVC